MKPRAPTSFRPLPHPRERRPRLVQPQPEAKPSPQAVLRGLATEAGELVAQIEILHERVAAAIASGAFFFARQKVKEYSLAEHLQDLDVFLNRAQDDIGFVYDDLTGFCGLPTREQA